MGTRIGGGPGGSLCYPFLQAKGAAEKGVGLLGAKAVDPGVALGGERDAAAAAVQREAHEAPEQHAFFAWFREGRAWAALQAGLSKQGHVDRASAPLAQWLMVSERDTQVGLATDEKGEQNQQVGHGASGWGR